MTEGMHALPPLLLVTVFAASLAAAPGQRTVQWQDLEPEIAGRQVQIVLPSGDVVKGKALRVNPDALLVQVRGKGVQTAPRAQISTILVSRKGVTWRIVGTASGLVAGAAGAVAVALNCLFCRPSTGRNAAIIALLAGAPVSGYLIGNRADRRTLILTVAKGP